MMLAAVQWSTSDHSIVIFKWSIGPRAREIAQFHRTVALAKCGRDPSGDFGGMAIVRFVGNK
jgi:hypothetical protein